MSILGVGATVADAITEVGQTVTLRRLGSGAQDVTMPGVFLAYQLTALVANISQGDYQLVISNREIAAAGWPGPPRHADRVICGGRVYTVQSVNTDNVNEEVVKHTLQVRGGS